MAKKTYILLWALLMVGILGLGESLYGHGDSKNAISPETLSSRIGRVKILDVRSEDEYEKDHIATSLVIPLIELSEARLNQLGFQKKDEIVIYANSGSTAKKAKMLLEIVGFKSVKILTGGLVHWKEGGYPTVPGKMEVKEKRKTKRKTSSIMLKPAEYDFGIIKKADGIVVTDMSLVNMGKEEVKIEEITTSCGCTTAEVANNFIRPGSPVALHVFFDPNFHKEPPGRFSRTIFIQTSEEIELQAKIYVQIED